MERNLIQLRGVIAILFSLLCIGCDRKGERLARNIERSFYHWKTTLDITPHEITLLDSLDVRTLYVKFYDVDYDANSKKPTPVGVLRSEEADLQRLREQGHNSVKYRIIPTIFITENCIRNIDSSQIVDLVNNIYTLTINTIASNGFDHIAEYQFDCDWTESTRDKYFLLLKKYKALVNAPVSATIRLHQIKFTARSGIPPVDRGLLMAYNMGNLKDPAASNSILDVEEMKKYLGNLKAYPLPLDVALPLFSWNVWFRNNAFKGIIYDQAYTSDRGASSDLSDVLSNRTTFKKDTTINGHSFLAGDILRSETSELKDVIKAGEEISRLLPSKSLRVALFHLDSLILNKYSSHDLESIFISLH